MGQRLGAGFIDLLVIWIYLAVAYYFIFKYNFLNDFKSTGEITLGILLFLPAILYYPLLEFFTGGRTVGKSLLKLRVAHKDGKPASVSEIILRWLLRMIDVKIAVFIFILTALLKTVTSEINLMATVGVFAALPFPIIGIISILMTKNNQRIGDLAAETIVIHNQKRISLEQTILIHKVEDYTPVFKKVLELRDKDIYIIKKVVEQAALGDHSKVLPLAKKAKEILKIESDLLPLVFLKTLMKDYNHLAQEKDL